MNGSPRRAGVMLVAFALLGFTGCYSVEEAPDRTEIRFAPVWRFLMIAAPLVLVVGGIVLCRFRPARIPGAILAVGSLGLSGLIVPGMYLDTVVITPTEMSQTTGFWFAQKSKGFRYADVRSVSIREVPEGESTMRIWTLHRKDGTTQEIDPGDLWNFNEAMIVAKLRGYGVAFER